MEIFSEINRLQLLISLCAIHWFDSQKEWDTRVNITKRDIALCMVVVANRHFFHFSLHEWPILLPCRASITGIGGSSYNLTFAAGLEA